ncbi:MAG: FtsW/RodA/SpoVE family cell cycle protein, partial [Oscillospiraceae bacterium]
MKKFFYGFKTFFKETDKLLFCLCSATSIFGILMVMSATRCKLEEGQIITRTALVMIAAVAFGIVLSLFISFFDYRIFTKLWPIIGVVCVGLMVALFFFGKAPILRPDSKIWLSFGPVDFQPSELLKIGFIITFGVHLEKLGHKINNPLNILGLAVHAIVPTALVVKTGDMGSALVFLVITAIMLFIAGIHWGYFVGGIALIGAASPLIWTYVLQPLQRDRFLALINPDLYPAVIYQQKLGLNAIGAGGFNGQGLFKGAYTQGGVVPESQNDMIFSVIGEELGFIGCTIALLLLTLIVLRMIYVGKKS